MTALRVLILCAGVAWAGYAIGWLSEHRLSVKIEQVNHNIELGHRF